MRYILDTDNPRLMKKLLEKNEGSIELVQKYEPIEVLTSRVEKLGRLLEEYKDSGANWEILNYYLRGKGISQIMINSVMKGIKSFFREFGIEL